MSVQEIFQMLSSKHTNST